MGNSVRALPVLALIVLSLAPARLQAASKVTVTPSNIDSFEDFVAGKGRAYSTACYESTGVALGKSKQVSTGAKFKVYLHDVSNPKSSEIRKFLRRLNKKRKKNPTAPAAKVLKLKVKSIRNALSRCFEDDGSGGGGGNGGGGNGSPKVGPERPSVGINVEWVSDWTTEIKFVDRIKAAREWVAKNADGSGWDVGTLTLRPDGYPTHIPQTNAGISMRAANVIGLEQQGLHMPAGNYTFSFKGTGTVSVSGNGTGDHTYTQAGTYTISYTASDGGIWIDIERSEASDPIRDMHFVMPGHVDTYQSQPFYPPFIDFMDDFTVVRFTQTMQTNSGTYVCDNGVEATDATCTKAWSNRNTTEYFTQASPKGVALELLIDMANAANVDPWISVPHGANADYIKQMARLVRDRLNSNLKVYIEYSNEVWNYAFDYPQSQWARANGIQLGLEPEDPYLAGLKFFAQETVNMIRIFRLEFGSQSDRVVGVLGAWVDNAWLADQMLTHISLSSVNPDGTMPDVVASGVYVGVWIADAIRETGAISSTTVSQIIDWVEQNVTQSVTNPAFPDEPERSIATMVQEMTDIIVKKYGLIHIAYEGGTHLVESRGWDNNEQLGAKLVAANRHARMGTVYKSLLNTWREQGGTLFVAYAGVGGYSNIWGSFAHKEYYSQTANEAPRWGALLSVLQDWLG